MFFLFVSERAKMINRTCTATVLDNKTFATLKDTKWTGINQKKSTRQRTTSHSRLVRRQVLSPCCPWTQSSVKAALLRQSIGRVPGCHWPAVSAPPPRDGAPPPPCSSRQDEGSGWGRCRRARTPPAPSPRRFLRTAGIQKQTNQKTKTKSTQRHSERQKPRLSLLTPAVTQAEVCDRLHLAQVPGASVDDAGVNSTLPGEGRDCGPPGERAKLGARDDPQPVVGRALVGIHTLLFTSNIRCKHGKCAKSSFPSSGAYLASFWKATLVGQSVRWAVIGAWVQHVSQHPAIRW